MQKNCRNPVLSLRKEDENEIISGDETIRVHGNRNIRIINKNFKREEINYSSKWMVLRAGTHLALE